MARILSQGTKRTKISFILYEKSWFTRVLAHADPLLGIRRGGLPERENP